MQRLRSGNGVRLAKIAAPWAVPKVAPLRMARRGVFVNASSLVPLSTGLRRVDLQEVEKTLPVYTAESTSWATKLWKGGWCALLLALSLMPSTTSALMPRAPLPAQTVSVAVHGRAASLSTGIIRTSLHKVSIQPPVLRFTAFVGSAMLATSTAIRWRCRATMAEMEPSEIEDETELDPSPAKPVIFALGLASVLVDTFRLDLPKQQHLLRPDRPKTSNSRPKSSYDVHLDINADEYDVLASILKRTKESSTIHSAKLDPIRRLLTAPQMDITPKTPFRRFVERLEEKTKSDVSFLRRFIMRLSNRGRGKYDCMKELASFEGPPAEAGMLRSMTAPADSKYDFLAGLLKGQWRVPTRDDIPYWDPRSLLVMLTEQPAVQDLNGARVIRQLGDFSADPPHPYDPLDVVNEKADAERNGLVRSTKEPSWNGAQKRESKTNLVTSKPSSTVTNSQSIDPYSDLSKIKKATMPKRDQESPLTDLTGECDMDAVDDVSADLAKDRPISTTQSIHRQETPSSNRIVGDQNQISAHLQEIEKHLNTASLLAEDANQVARNALKSEVEQIKSMHGMHHEPSSTNGATATKSALKMPAAQRVQETMRQITCELKQVSHEISKMNH